jgi:hypothetical protein
MVMLIFCKALAEGTVPTQGCTITAQHCANFPELSRTQFRDTIGEDHFETSSNDAACLKRAEDFHHWCGNNASGGAQVAATYNSRKWSQVYHPDACGVGWSQWDAFCYRFHLEMKTWYDAEERCRQDDAHLVSIHSQAENRFVFNLQLGLQGWIGYTDVDHDTHYQWSDNTHDDFSNFAKNYTGREHELDCKREEIQQEWYSSSGESRSPYTCKRNAFVPGLALLKNSTAQDMLVRPWSLLLPALTLASQRGGVNILATASTEPALKIQEMPSANKNPEVIQKGTMPRLRTGVTVGSFL